MQGLWWLFALFAGFMTAMFVFANQIFRLKGSMVMIYRGVGTALVLLPFAFFVTPVHDTNFYFLCILNGLIIAFLDNRVMNASKTFGAETAAMLQPLSIIFEFFAWFFFAPQMISPMLADPIRLILTMICLGVLAISVLLIKRNNVSRRAFLFLLPVMVSVTIIDINCKILMSIDIKELVNAIFYYSMITSAVAGSINAVIYFKNGNPLSEVFMPRNLMFVGIPLVVLMLSIYTFKNLSLHYVENPAYTMAILNLYPIWVSLANNLYNKYAEHKPYPKPNRKVLFMITASVILLILTVN